MKNGKKKRTRTWKRKRIEKKTKQVRRNRRKKKCEQKEKVTPPGLFLALSPETSGVTGG